MKKHHLQDLGLEAIEFQNGALFSELTGAIARVRSGKKITQESIDAAGIAEIVKSRTGLTVEVLLKRSFFYNAAAMPPIVNKDHPFINRFRKRIPLDEKGIEMIAQSKRDIIGTVDRKRSRVGGVYSELVSKIYLFSALLESDKFSDGEIAAIFLHELGHIFTYFEFMGHSVTTNFVLSCTVAAIQNTQDLSVKTDILKAADHALGVDSGDRMRIAKTKSEHTADVVTTVYISKLSEKYRSEHGASLYDLRSWEQLSDQFATRHGAGRDLVTGLDKIYRTYLNSSTVSASVFYGLQVLKLLMLLNGIVFAAMGNVPAAVITVVRLFFNLVVMNPQQKLYDDPEARVRLIRQQLNEALKDKTLEPEERQFFLDDIETIRGVEDTLKDRRGYIGFLWAYVLPWGRPAYKDEELMKQLEKLANNDLFEIANKFKAGTA